MRRILALLLACAFVVLLAGASAAPAKRVQADDCAWGASSVVVEEVDGSLVQGEPATSGCIPR